MLRWRVDSAFPVEEHNVYYERIVDGEVGFFIIIVVLIIMVKKEMSCRLYQEYFKPVHSCQPGRERYPLKNNDDVTRENVYLCDIIYRVSQLKQRMLLGPRCTRS